MAKYVTAVFGLVVVTAVVIIFSLSFPFGKEKEVIEVPRNGVIRISEDVVTPPRHQCESSWNNLRNSEENCYMCPKSRVARFNTYRAQQEECDVTLEILTGLQDVVNYALDYVSGEVLSPRFASSDRRNNDLCRSQRAYNVRSSCMDIVENMRTTMCDIIYQICLILNEDDPDKCDEETPTENPVSPFPTIRTTQPPGNGMECIICLFDQIKSYKIELQEVQNCFIHAIQEREQEYAADIRKLNETMDDLKKSVAASSWLLMLAQIENPETAAIWFPQYEYDDSKLKKYVEDVYSIGNYTNILSFGFRLPNITQVTSVYQKLYELIVDKDHANRGNILVFNKYFLDSQTKFCQIDACDATFRETMAHVKLTTKKYVKKASENIINGNWRGLLDFGNPTTVSDEGESFKLVIESLVAKSCRNFAAVLHFVKNIRWNEHRYLALRTLKSYIRNPYHMMSVAYEIKNAMETLNGPDQHKYEEVLANLVALKGSLDPSIRIIVWEERCTLKLYDGRNLCHSGGNFAGNDGVGLGCSDKDVDWSFVKQNENMANDNHGRYGYRIRYKNGNYLGAADPPRVALSSSELMCISSLDSGNWIDNNYYWQVKFGDNYVRDRIYLYHPYRRLHVDFGSLSLSGNLGTYLVIEISK